MPVVKDANRLSHLLASLFCLVVHYSNLPVYLSTLLEVRQPIYNMMKRTLLTGSLMAFLLIAHTQTTLNAGASKAAASSAAAVYPLIPYPTTLKPGTGQFNITTVTTMAAAPGFAPSVAALQQLVKQAMGRPLPVTTNQATAKIILRKEATITAAEGYALTITPQKITIAAGTPAGMFRAIETIRQLLPAEIETKKASFKSLSFPAVTITDAPTYAWRGLHLDVARHFFSVEYVEKLLDRMALYKMNKLHLHLTDDQGWRIEIKKYPVLTEKGAWRTFDANDSSCMRQAKENPDMAIDAAHIVQREGKTMYGGFYTQEQVKHLVHYAAARYIDIIPEIDMPGHMMAAIHQFPDLSCEGGSKWGELFSTPICPCNESTYAFAENVFSEIISLFPSEYIHLGADEVDRKSWAQSAVCQELMKKEGLKNTAELQSYFVKRMEKFFQSKGRKLIGWDEILEGGISSTANVMYWRSWVPDAPIVAARNGNHVIMSPGNPLYFDNLPDANSLNSIYHFKVVPEKLNAQQASYIIGAQANLWTERVPSEKRADYLYFPRMIALAERVWSKNLNYTSFQQRVTANYDRLEALDINYRLPDLTGFTAENVFVDQVMLEVQKPLPNLTLRYTTDGSLPTTTAKEMTGTININEPVTIKLAAFTPNGTRGEIYTLNYKKESYQESAKIADRKPGLAVNYYKKYYKNTEGMSGMQPDSQYTAPGIVVAPTVNAPSFGLQYTGYIEVPETGIYSFFLLADDGAILSIGDKLVINNDGQHGPIEKSGQVALQKGVHPFALHFIEAGGGFSLSLKYSFGKEPVQKVPDSFFTH